MTAVRPPAMPLHAAVLALTLAAAAGTAPAATAEDSTAKDSRTLRFTYQTTIGPVPEGAGPIHVWIPLAESDEHQDVLERTVRAPIDGELGRDRTHGNLFWHGMIAESDGRAIPIRVEHVVARRPFRKENLGRTSRPLRDRERRRLQRWLEPDARVPVGAPVLRPILTSVRESTPDDDPAATARAIYDWVVDNMEYKKIGTGWGHGDTWWACSERYGNCTDFHSLFNSLARTEGIPARFEIGFPIPEDRSAGKVGGYHCWTQFYLPRHGWVPIDASEAFKAPEKREAFYGGQGVDRIRFTTGRDLDLGPSHLSGPLNYFIYPHVEVAGVEWDGPMTKSFSYEDVGADQPVYAGQ